MEWEVCLAQRRNVVVHDESRKAVRTEQDLISFLQPDLFVAHLAEDGSFNPNRSFQDVSDRMINGVFVADFAHENESIDAGVIVGQEPDFTLTDKVGSAVSYMCQPDLSVFH